MQQFEKDIQNLYDDVNFNYSYAQALYAALCNTRWTNKKTGEEYTCSWRYAGGLIADMRGNTKNMNYMDFYCSGIEDGSEKEGHVASYIEDDMNELGWECKPWKSQSAGWLHLGEPGDKRDDWLISVTMKFLKEGDNNEE